MAKNKPASALILTMFILAGMMVAAFGGAYLAILGIKAGGIQSQSGKAYFAAEAGAERLLWELRKNGWTYGSPSTSIVFSDVLPITGASYQVYFSGFPPLIFRSVGEYKNTSRSVELRI